MLTGWYVITHRDGHGRLRGGRGEGGGTENVLRLQGKLSTRTLSKYVVRPVVKLEDCGLCLHVVE